MRKLLSYISMVMLLFTNAVYGEGALTTGTLKTKEHLIAIHYGSEGTLYSVKTLNGKLIESKISEKELISKLPYLEAILERGIADDASTNGRFVPESIIGGDNQVGGENY